MPARRLLIVSLALALVGATPADDPPSQPLFPADGPPAGWLVRAWNDLAQPAGPDTEWTVRDGILRPGSERGTWLVSEAQYGDFILEFEIQLTELGNSGVALRAPLNGDPAFDGMELQIADVRYNPEATAAELTGALYRALAPTEQVYQPEKWNAVRIELRGPRLQVTLNGTLIQNVDLSTLDQPTRRHDGSNAPPVNARPRRGHIGFQHLSRGSDAPVLIRNARITPLD